MGMMAPELAKAASPTRERNRARIVDAARRLWAHDPDASMDDVAREAGVVRRTLYGHFAHRDDLIMAVAAQAAEVLAGIAGRSTRGGAPASAELARLTLQVWSFARDWHLLGILAQQVDGASVERAIAPINSAFYAVVLKGQRQGEFSEHLPADVMIQILQVQAIKLHEASDSGAWSGGAEEAAVAALITVGVDSSVAANVVDAELGRISP
jgi:TetR/AcrR family transcriptional regulator, regulator of autoinduction and epiphytic fitness